MKTARITHVIRSLGLIHVLDVLKYQWQRWKYNKENRAFRKNNPGISLPPDYMLFESFQLNYAKYYLDGKDTIEKIVREVEKHVSLQQSRILDWGCGPGRLVRHLPSLLPQAEIHATDYNPQTISWCRNHIDNVNFALNQIAPPTNYEDESFDFIYGISIFTHLSEDNHTAWFDELIRILKPVAILYLTTHGDAFMQKMNSTELNKYREGSLVVRGHAKEGHRVFAAFQPKTYMSTLVSGKADILEHIPGRNESWGISQDIWILKKR